MCATADENVVAIHAAQFHVVALVSHVNINIQGDQMSVIYCGINANILKMQEWSF